MLGRRGDDHDDWEVFVGGEGSGDPLDSEEESREVREKGHGGHHPIVGGRGEGAEARCRGGVRSIETTAKKRLLESQCC